MLKLSKLSALLMFGALTVGASSCGGGEKFDLKFWHNFGGVYSGYLTDAVITPLKNTDKIDVFAEGKGGYDGLRSALQQTIASKTYPNIATGYPDHFAGYAAVGYPKSQTGILADLTPFMKDEAINKEHKEKYHLTLQEDFYEEYMVENNSICYDTAGNSLTIGIPFNKSTEVMGYNGIFVDYVIAKETEAGHEIKVPSTWAEMATYGPTFRSYQLGLCGKYLNGDLDSDGKGSNFSVSETKTSKTLLEFDKCTPENSAIISWDSLANMFITLVRQYGSQFTSYDKTKRQGYVEFYTGEANKAATTAALQMVRDLAGNSNESRIFAYPGFFSDGQAGAYSSTAFAANKVMFTICSTGGLTYNLKNEGQRFRIAPVPYKDADHKYVISQGANLTVFDRTSEGNSSLNKADTVKLAFKAIVKMATGEYQAEWAKKTGYYPASRSAATSKTYQDFLNGSEDPSDPSFATKRAYREGAKLNNDEYMNAEKHWIKFVDPGFDGSAGIRTRVEYIISTLIDKKDQTIDNILRKVYADQNVSPYVHK